MQSITITSIKARCEDANSIRAFLCTHHARFVGTDHQRDTYFNVPHGKLKLRQGSIENALIHTEGYLPLETGAADLGNILDKAVGTVLVVERKREIYFIDNVRFQLDEIEGEGYFVEIEALDPEDQITEAELARQCQFYRDALGV
jgi:adenylate cyclase class 2